MGESAIQGTCEACGKQYRVPSAERTYTCKACGGTVSVAAQGAGKASPPTTARPAVAPRARRARGEDDGDEANPRPSARRRRATSSSRTGWIVLAVLLVVSGVGFGLYKSGAMAKVAGAEKDLGKVTASFAEDWSDGDLDDLADWYHPDGRAAFRARLDKVAANRGWTDGFPTIVQQTERVVEGTIEEPERGASLLLWGDEMDSVTVQWQFEPSRTRWYAYSVELVPPPLGPRVAAFRDAWAQSDPAALHPFFRADAKEKMAELVARKADSGGWAASFPKLGEPEITGEAGARNPAARLLGGSRPESIFPVTGGDGGELLVKWSFRDEDDAWIVTGFRFP